MKPRRESNHLLLFRCLVFSLWLFNVQLSHAADTLTAGEVMRDWQFLESPNKFFRLLFFVPVYSSHHYLGIQSMYSFETKIVWVANRENPLKDTSGYLNITKEGILMINDSNGTSIIINSEKPVTSSNTSVTLLDSGNLVLRAGQRVLWQSFDHPSDTILQGMKFGLFDLKRKQPRNLFLTSWLSPGVPASGAFTLGVDPNNTKELVVWRRGLPYWRSGSWNGQNFSYFPHYYGNFKFSYISNENESYFTYTLTKDNFSWIEMNSTGTISIFLLGFEFSELGPVLLCDGKSEYISEGCVKQKPSKCSSGDEFPATIGTMEDWTYSNNFSLGLDDCKEICRKNCNCTAYGSASSDGSGCRFSYGKRIEDSSGTFSETFYIRNSTAQNGSRVTPKKENNSTPVSVYKAKFTDLQNTEFPKLLFTICVICFFFYSVQTSRKRQRWIIIVSPVISLILLILGCSLCYIVWKKFFSKGERGSTRKQVGRDTQKFIHELGNSIAAIDENGTHNLWLTGKKDHELPLFSFSTIETATEFFSEENKLGQGGFGPVYKGTLVNGQEIAVKRLSERSGQGQEEFKTEVILISKVQHRNLVRLLGCCIKGEEKILIYEYLANKSLDTFLFDETKRFSLDWRMRVNIIEGIAQGLLYLHKYSRLKIIHRDLKISNILLDNNMSPKISDFGTAKIFGDNESRANTNRIVGTYGYMSPEYAMDGLFSVKSDVFSFGVMMLEIISGKKNLGFYQPNHSSNLVGHAWNLWKEGRSFELLDPAIGEACSANEIMRNVQVALLCVQENAADRPTMSEIVSMLGSDMGLLPDPNQPAFYTPVRAHDNNLADNAESCPYDSIGFAMISDTLASKSSNNQ
ncbi:Serine/threonine protein kinase [Trema orientale]|uniref:Receptor-like serine/threonine-protein kinase n=1 Tax=Trema orientale TaxID=63057 RepID=A0A2P5CM46_TREOI|nr:Serine/threonine protein kinase [Trema orientale]